MTSRIFRASVAVAATAAALVATVGPAAEADAAAASGSIRALSYNVAGLNEHLSGSEPQINSPLISPLLNDYELVLLQEDWGDPNQPLRDAGLDVPALNYHHEIVRAVTHPFQSIPAAHPYGNDLRRAGSGATVMADGLNRLSTYEFDGADVLRAMWRTCFGDIAIEVAEAGSKGIGLGKGLDTIGQGHLDDDVNGGASDCAAQKGFSLARTTVADGVTIDVYNLHADAGSHQNDIDARADNFAQLAEFINDNSAGNAIILGGDTNLKTGANGRPGDLATWTTFLGATGLSDVCRATACGNDDHVIDKFAFRDGGTIDLTPVTHRFERDVFVRATDGAPLSDHDALAVTFDWTA